MKLKLMALSILTLLFVFGSVPCCADDPCCIEPSEGCTYDPGPPIQAMLFWGAGDPDNTCYGEYCGWACESNLFDGECTSSCPVQAYVYDPKFPDERSHIRFITYAGDKDWIKCGDATEWTEFDDNKKFGCQWSGVDESHFYSDCHTNNEATKKWNKTGIYNVSCTVSDECSVATDPSKTYNWVVWVKPLPPTANGGYAYSDDCFWYFPGDEYNVPCDSGSDGCGSCGRSTSSGFPDPDIREPLVRQSFDGASSIIGPGTGENNECGSEKVEVFDTWSGMYVRCSDHCGNRRVYRLPGFEPDPWGRQLPGDPNQYDSFSFTLGGFTNVTGKIYGDKRIELTFTDSDGRKSMFSVPPPPAGVWMITQGPNSVIEPDGSTTTTFNRGADGGLNSVVESNGDTWTYERNLGDTRITKATEPGGTYVDISYVPGGQQGEGKLQSLVTRSNEGTVTSETTYSYDSSNRLYMVTKGNRTRTFDYSEDGRKITVKDISGTQVLADTEYDYGTSGSATTIVTRKHDSDPAKDEVTAYGFYLDGASNRTYVGQITDPNGKVTTYNVNTSTGLTNSITEPSGVTTSYSYNSNGAVTQITYTTSDSQTATETNTYYTDGGSSTVWLRTHRDIRGTWTYYQRNSSTLWQVDAIKIAPTRTEPDWNTVSPIKQYEYYGASDPDGMPGLVKREITPNIDGTTAQVTVYKYSESGKKRNSPTQTIYQYWNGSAYETKTSTTHYDDGGGLLSTTDANGRTTWYRYGALGRQTLAVYKWVNDVVDGTPEVYTQNSYSCCTLDWTRDENGNKTYYAYDDLNRMTKTWTDVLGQDADHPLVEYTYDAFGNQATLTTWTDAITSKTIFYTYDKNNRVTRIDYPGDTIGHEELGYDDVGNLWWKKDGNGAVTLYRYDTRHRLTNVYYNYAGSLPPTSYPANADVTYAYDGNSSLKTSMHDSSGVSSYTYDQHGRLKTYTPPLGLQSGYYVQYDYNNLGQKKYEKIRDNTTPTPNVLYDAQYEYYANGWLKAVKSGSNTIASYTYDVVANRVRTDYGNGSHTLYAFDTDPRYRLESITHKKGSQSLAAIGYPSRDNIGNPLTVTDWTGTWTYTYDDNSRLKTATPPNPVPDQPAGGSYGYDWLGNRLNPPAGSNHMVYNGADQLTNWPGMYSYTYYDDGSMHKVKNAAGSFTHANYTYTPNGLLNAAEFNSQTLTNTWNADADRVNLNVGGVNYSFVYDPTAGLPAVIRETCAAGATFYYREPDGILIAAEQNSSRQYYHFDSLGSTRILTDDSGAVTDKYAYDAYGSLIAHDRLAGSVDQPYQYVGQLGYYTHWQSPDFALLQLGIRFYDPATSRFTQRDPEFDGANAYAYADLGPTVVVDPTGAVPEFSSDYLKCIDKAIGQLPFGKDFGWPKGLDNSCRGLSTRECWVKITRCLVWAESGDNPNAKNPNSSARGMMQIMLSCNKDGCTKRLRAIGMLKSNEEFNWQDACQNMTCGIYILYGCAMKGGLTKCAKSTYTSIGGPKFNDCMKNWWPPKPKK